MNKAENTRSGLVFPSDDFSEEISYIKRCLQNAGFPDADATWLVEVFQQPDCFGVPDGDSAFTDDFEMFGRLILPSIVEGLAKPDQTEEDRQIRLALLFSFLLGFGPRGNNGFQPKVGMPKDSSDSSTIPQWIVEFQRNGNFLANLIWHRLIEIRTVNVNELVPFIFPEGVSLAEIVNLELLNPIQRRGGSSNDFEDPQQLEYWLIWRFHADTERRNTIKLDTLWEKFSDFSEDVLGDKILGLLNAIGYAMNISSALGKARLNPLNDGWRVVAQELIPFLELLTEKQPDLHRKRSSLLKAWWRLAKTIYSWGMDGLESELCDDLRDKLVESAAKHIGILRSILRDTPEVFEEEDSSGTVADFYGEAFHSLLGFGAPWKCLKPLLLAFTEMTVPAVTRDLRAWSELDEKPPPHPYSEIPLWIAITMYPQNLRKELGRDDPHLQELREEFAKFCIDRLRTKTKHENPEYTDEDFVEPRPAWRQCYVQALVALRVNPGGRAHRTLFWISKNDPDEEVRESAQRAHKQVRHLDRRKPNLDEGASPRRPLFEAFWWLRQAHLLTLGIKIDKPGALRTRRKELHRTREKSDRLN